MYEDVVVAANYDCLT